MYTTEVKTRDDKIKSLTVALQEAQDRIAELESIISHEQMMKPKTWDDFEREQQDKPQLMRSTDIQESGDLSQNDPGQNPDEIVQFREHDDDA